jgi:thioredoxin-related protein
MFSFVVNADVTFKVQTLSQTLPEAQNQQKLIMYVCSSKECRWCRWMDENVYIDPEFSNTINNNFISIKPTAQLDRMEFYTSCSMLPSIIFYDEDGSRIHKLEGKQTLAEMKNVVNEILTTHCTGLDQKLDETTTTHKEKVCCEGLIKTFKNGEKYCSKTSCVENSELGIDFNGDPQKAMPCCDDSAKKNVIPRINGMKIHCFEDQKREEFNDHENSKSDIIIEPIFQKKTLMNPSIQQ